MISFLSFLISLVSFTNFSRCAGFYLINATRFPFWSSSDLRRNHFVITKDFIPAIAGFSILLNLYWCNFLHELCVLGKINETLIFSVAILFCWAIFYQDPAAHQKCFPPMLVWDPPVPNCRFGGTRLHTRRPLTGRWEPPDPMGPTQVLDLMGISGIAYFFLEGCIWSGVLNVCCSSKRLIVKSKANTLLFHVS